MILKSGSKKFPSMREFTILMALLISITAMSIDMILPAMPLIGNALGISSSNSVQYLIIFLFVGFAVGQLVGAPISDSVGRKTVIYAGLIIHIIGSIVCLYSSSFSVMLFGRFLQGFGAAGPRNVSFAVTRDLYSGREMARVVSFVMAVFIMTPVFAPSIGQLILQFGSWKLIFIAFAAISLTTLVLIFARLPETLSLSKRKPFTVRSLLSAFLYVFTNKTTLMHCLCIGFVFGGLMGYISSASQIFVSYYNLGSAFPICFAISAASIGVASFVNSKIVRKYGMRKISIVSLSVICVTTLAFYALSALNGDILMERVRFEYFMVYIVFMFFWFGLLFGNLNSMAMEPMGEHAGMASGIIGFLSSSMSVVIAITIGQCYSNNLIPIVFGFFAISLPSLLIQKYLVK